MDYPNDGTCSRFHSQSTANLVYGKMRDFMGRYGHTALRMGEANSGQRCADHTPISARHAADGYRSSTLRAVFGTNVYFTAWNNASDTTYCSETPYYLPHYNPFAQ